MAKLRTKLDTTYHPIIHHTIIEYSLEKERKHHTDLCLFLSTGVPGSGRIFYPETNQRT